MKMKRLIGLILCACCYFPTTAQDGHCGVEHPTPQGAGEAETDNGNNNCFGCETFTMKTLKLKIHVIRDKFGENNFSPEEEHLLELIVNTANEKLSANSNSCSFHFLCGRLNKNLMFLPGRNQANQ